MIIRYKEKIVNFDQVTHCKVEGSKIFFYLPFSTGESADYTGFAFNSFGEANEYFKVIENAFHQGLPAISLS